MSVVVKSLPKEKLICYGLSDYSWSRGLTSEKLAKLFKAIFNQSGTQKSTKSADAALCRGKGENDFTKSQETNKIHKNETLIQIEVKEY